MTIQGFNNGEQIFATAMQIFNQFDITIEIGSDFNKYRLLFLEHRPQQPLWPSFDPNIHQLKRPLRNVLVLGFLRLGRH